MRVLTHLRWLPVDTILGDDVAKATDAALAPLAAKARRIRRNGVLRTALLLASAVVLLIVAAGPGGPIWGFVAVASAVIGGVQAVVMHRLWGGDLRWMGKSDRSLSEPELPPPAATLLAELRSGARRARYRRGQSGHTIELVPQQLRGPFGSTLLSSVPEVQSLAMRDWFGGDQLSVEIEHDATPSLTPDLPTEVDELPVDRSTSDNPLGLDHRLLMEPEELNRLLARAYPVETRGTRESLIFDAHMLGNELVQSCLVPKLTKTLVARIVVGLKSPNGRAVKLVADDGSSAVSEYLFRHRKTIGAGYQKVGLKPGSDSSAWIEQIVAGRYKDIKHRLDAAEEQVRTH